MHRWAKRHGLKVHMRFEDLDPLRSKQEFLKNQVATLREFGIHWDEESLQSEMRPWHEEALQALLAEGHLYACICSRKKVHEDLVAAPHGPAVIYTGRCRQSPPELSQGLSVSYRFRSADGSDDIVVARGPWGGVPVEFAYHWACALDDWRLGPTHIVRAWDLAAVAKTHSALFECFNSVFGKTQRYPKLLHTSLVVRPDGSRLEKRSGPEELPKNAVDVIEVSLDHDAIEKLQSEKSEKIVYDPSSSCFVRS
jgi:glutamyl/glutaminyl-tRNA synthetase